MSMSAMAARVAALLLASEKGRKGVGFLLVAIFAPVILIAAILCSATSGGADHNNAAVEASFYGISFTDTVPTEFRTHIADMQTAFSLLDSAVAEANAAMTDGNRLDPIQVKAIFYALCFGEDAPSRRAADRFVDCFFITEERTRIESRSWRTAVRSSRKKLTSPTCRFHWRLHTKTSPRNSVELLPMRIKKTLRISTR